MPPDPRGDGTCDASEDCGTCEADCGPCGAPRATGTSANFVGNYTEPGPSSDYQVELKIRDEAGQPIGVYLEGNLGPNRPTDDLAEDLIVDEESRAYLARERYDFPEITTSSATEARDEVYADAGASRAIDCAGQWYVRRDAVDERIINNAMSGGGGFISDPDDVGGYPVLDMGEPCPDADHDGMPDEWETANGFDPDDPSDSPLDADEDGYTNLEEYLNGTPT